MKTIILTFVAALVLHFADSCVSAAPAPVPQTGQTTCYDSIGRAMPCVGTGMDGAIKGGVAWPVPRFVDNGNGTVSDNLTGLLWTKDANAPGPTACTPATSKSWQQALDYAACLNSNSYLGFNDWRVPSIRELGGLVDASRSNPPLPAGHPFTSVQSSFYWSGSTYAGYTDSAWVVVMSDGHMGYVSKTDSYSVWPVRSGQ